MPVSEATAGELARLQDSIEAIEADVSRLDVQSRSTADRLVRLEVQGEGSKGVVGELRKEVGDIRSEGRKLMISVILFAISIVSTLIGGILTFLVQRGGK